MVVVVACRPAWPCPMRRPPCSSHAETRLTTSPITATTSAVSIAIGSARHSRSADSPRCPRPPAEHQRAREAAQHLDLPGAEREARVLGMAARQRVGRPRATPSASACVPMCQPSASSAIEPVHQPARSRPPSSRASAPSTQRVRASPRRLPASNDGCAATESGRGHGRRVRSSRGPCARFSPRAACQHLKWPFCSRRHRHDVCPPSPPCRRSTAATPPRWRRCARC
jgi:hypothetical protein